MLNQCFHHGIYPIMESNVEPVLPLCYMQSFSKILNQCYYHYIEWCSKTLSPCYISCQHWTHYCSNGLHKFSSKPFDHWRCTQQNFLISIYGNHLLYIILLLLSGLFVQKTSSLCRIQALSSSYEIQFYRWA